MICTFSAGSPGPLDSMSPSGFSAARASGVVVPGSTVLVNGEDVTDVVDRSGLLSANVNVYPIGDNIISILVRTPNHVTQAALMGADIATVPFGALKKCLKHPLTDQGMASFDADWAKVVAAQ